MNLKYDKKHFKPGETHILFNNINLFHEQNIYFVSTPGQMLSAIEAQNYFQTENNVLVVLFFNTKVINEIFSLLEYFPYSKLITYQNQTKKNHIAFTRYLDNITKYEYNHVFVGYNSPLYRRMVANIDYKKLYYLDTGAHAITTQEQIYNDYSFSQKNPYKSFVERSKNAKLTTLSYKLKFYEMDHNFEDLNFFTVFKMTAYKDENIIVHQYEHVKKLFSNDISLYSSILLSIYNATIVGQRSLLNKRLTLDIPLKEKSILSSSGIALDIYPDTITSIKGYQQRLEKNLILHEKSFLEMKINNDREFLKKLQYALVFKDNIVFNLLINMLIETFQTRMLEILDPKTKNKQNRVMGMLSTLREALKLLFLGIDRFSSPIKIKEIYSLFDLFFVYLDTIANNSNKIKVLDSMALLYVSYAKGIKENKDKQLLDTYLYIHAKDFKYKLVKVLSLLPSDYYGENSQTYHLANDLLEKNFKYNRYKQRVNYFYQTLELAHKLNQNKYIEILSQYLIKKNFKIVDIKLHLKTLEILLSNTTDTESIKNRIWDIYSKATYSRTHRIEAGLMIARFYYIQGKHSKATKLYFQIWHKLGCENRIEALDYLDAMKVLELAKSYKNIFEKLYNQYIFGPYLKTYNSRIVIDFLEYQDYLYLQEMTMKNSLEYTNRPIHTRYDRARFKAGDIHILYDELEQNKKQNLYIVSTPGQMLSAIEAQNYFKTENNVLVILFFVVRDGKNINQMFKLAELFPYSKLITYQNKSAQFYISFIPFLLLLKKINVNYLFFGFNTILYRRMVANITYEKLYYLDDGVHTITTHEDTYNKLVCNTKPEYKPFPKTINLQKMKFIYGKNGLKVDTYLNDLNFFTVYNLKPYQNETIIKHNFSHISNLLIKETKNNNCIYVLGQPLVEIVGVPQDEYTKYLTTIFTYYSGYDIYFIPHRLEIIHEDVQEYIAKHDNINILIPDDPIEFYLLNNSIYPLEVVSFITSALFNIRKLFPKTKTKAFEIDLKNLEAHHQQGIKLIYKHFISESVEIVDLEKQKQYMSRKDYE